MSRYDPLPSFRSTHGSLDARSNLNPPLVSYPNSSSGLHNSNPTLQSTSPTLSAANARSRRNTYRDGTFGGASFTQRMAASVEQRLGTGSQRVTTCLRDIEPVSNALALLPDDSHILRALGDALVTNETDHSAPLRTRILNFRGFLPSSTWNYHHLLVLNKSDLDILAWIFHVSKAGRKDDVARRILGSLQLPIMYRRPMWDRMPMALSKLNSTHAGTSTTTGGPYSLRRGASAHARQNPATSNAPVSSLQPGTPPTTLRTEDPFAMSRETLPRLSGRATSILQHQSVQTRSKLTAAEMRRKQAGGQLAGLLSGYSFMDAENPFNEPLNAPLGTTQNYAVFTSMQLTRGNSDPVLMFATPSQIDPAANPKVKGGEVQIHLRCLKVDQKKPRHTWKQSWPFPASCRVNGHAVSLNQAQRYTNGKLAGIDTATNISPYLRKYKPNSNDSNRVRICRQSSSANPSSGQFVVFAQEILVYTSKTMADKVHKNSERYWIEHTKSLQSKGLITPTESLFEISRQGVVKFLTNPDGLTVSSMKVSLRCPLALTRIVTPVKGKLCQHVQCFDLNNFLEYTRRSSKFDCPVCNKSTAYPEMLIISPYIENALGVFEDCDEVEIFQDGKMVAVERKNTGVASDDEDLDVERPQHIGGSGKGPAEVVDLTLDSDDDEPPAHDSRGQSNGVRTGAGITAFSGDNQRQNGTAVVTENEDDGGIEGVGLDQELDFSFHAADFIPPWAGGDGGQVDDANQPTSGSNGNAHQGSTSTGLARNSWPVDVISIDSD